uniref:Uncharacterized protein n=1 Tax=Heliothis virescens TaxID=7102 RepID=A0A2A4JME2_HELVI
MSPKKSVKNPTIKRKNAEKPMLKRTVRKETGRSNRTVNLKVSIPLTNATADGIHAPIVKGRRPPQYKKNLDVDTKVALANSVARQQLVKNEVTPPSFEPDNLVFIQNPKIRKRATKNRVISDFFDKRVVLEKKTPDDTVSSTATKPQVKEAPQITERPRRIVTRKRLADSTAQLDAKRPKVEPNTEAVPLNAKIKIENVQSVDVVGEPYSHLVVNQPETSDEQPQSTEAKIEPEAKNKKCAAKRGRSASNKPPTTKRPVSRKKRTPKGKQETVTDDQNSPSILDQLRKPKKPAETKIGPNPDTSAPVNSRKSSVSSISNLSWTRDISESSTTTCITVSPNDFVRFNKKLPVLILTNIDNELKKRQTDVQQNTVSTDVQEGEDSSDSSDSEDTDNERDFSELDLINRNTSQLSDSSPSQYSQGRNKVSSEYAKAADKLTATMKKLDMEIINWISSDNEDVNANLAKFKDRMFDILDSEFGIITHCRRLQEILEPAKVNDDICVTETVSNKDKNAQNNDEKDNSNTDDTPVPVKEITKEKEPEPEFVKPPPVRKLSSISEVSNTSARAPRDDSSDDEPADGGRNSYYDHHDDDDALSLYAESISGFESIRMNPSVVSAPVTRPVEEYIPKPVKQDIVINTEKPTYCPTKIRENTEAVTSKNICEKQNADSTSIYKQSISTDDNESYQDFNEHIDLDARLGAPDMVKKPRLMDSFFEGMPKARSVVFGNLCFYNLMNCCRKVYYGQCRFVHMIPSSDEIKAKLPLLNERMLIQEYLLVRNWVELRRRYGMCYVEECAKRGLTRILVEMAYDFIVKARSESEEDTRLRVNTIEIALLHLNTVDLSICEDLLKLVIHSDQTNRTLLCDVFMATMSITQNFSRFKLVFLNLTYFMVDNDRTFNKDVVEHILERVCILSFEEPIARALIQMMRLTKSEIFNNSMIRLFEKQISVNKDVFEEYSSLKNQCAFTSMLASSVLESPPLLEDLPLSGRSDRGDGVLARSDGQMSALDEMATRVERGDGQFVARSDLGDTPQSARSDNSDGQPPAPSPDTTNLDKMNKSLEEPAAPIITRTIGMNPPLVFNRVPTSPGASRFHEASGPMHESPSKPHVFASDDAVAGNFGKWRNRSIFPHMPPPPRVDRPTMRAPSRTPMRPHMRQPFRRPFNQRLVTFRSPSVCIPDFISTG